jgi:hypothetical protein
MESTITFISILFIVFGILQIILFFKIWGMTNDVREIKEAFLYNKHSNTECGYKNVEPQRPTEEFQNNNGDLYPFKIGELVIIKATEGQFRISNIKIEGDTVYYYSDKFQEGFKEQEIENFEKYWKDKQLRTKMEAVKNGLTKIHSSVEELSKESIKAADYSSIPFDETQPLDNIVRELIGLGKIPEACKYYMDETSLGDDDAMEYVILTYKEMMKN